MSLVIVPLPSGDPAVDQQVRGVIERLLGGAPRYGANELDVRPVEPIVVAALDREGWDTGHLRKWVDARVVHLPERAADTPARDAGPDAGRVNVLREALEAVLEHQALLRLANEDRELRSGIVWLVVGVPPRADSAPDALLQGFEQVARWTEAAALEVSRGRFVGHDVPTLALDGMNYLPWVLLPRPPSAPVLPAALRSAPTTLGGLVRPIVYTGRAVGGHAFQWSVQGRERLFADMTALHAMSASADLLRAVLGDSHDGVEFLTFHGSTFEYPLSERIRHARLGHILARGDGDEVWRHVLPNKDRLDSARERAAPGAATAATTWSGRVREAVVRDELPPTHYDFGGAYPHRPNPSFDGLEQPSEARWQDYVDDAWPLLDPPRQVDTLHRQVTEALDTAAREDAPRVVEAAVRQARASMQATKQELEAFLRGQITLWNPAPELAMSRFAYSVGVTLAVLEAARAEAARHVRSETSLPDPREQVRASVARLQAQWEGDEDALMRAGAKVPSRGAIALELGIALLGGAASTAAFAASVLLLPLAVLSGLVTVIGIYLLWRKRRAELTAYFERWAELAGQWRSAANFAARPLVQANNDRAREVKKLAAQELVGVLEGCIRRFRLEVRGFIDLVEKEHAELSRRRELELSRHEAARVGRFRFSPDADIHGMDKEAERVFVDDLCRAIGPSLALVGMPERVPVAIYEDILARSLVTDADELRLRERHREGATRVFENALVHGWDEQGVERSDVEAFYPDPRDSRGGRRFVIAGASIDARLEAGWEDGELLRGDVSVLGKGRHDADTRAVVRSMTPELAVSFVVRGWRKEATDA